MISTRLAEETAWPILIGEKVIRYDRRNRDYNLCFNRNEYGETYSAAYVRLCINNSSTSLGFWTRKTLCPDGIIWRVFLLLPYPIYWSWPCISTFHSICNSNLRRQWGTWSSDECYSFPRAPRGRNRTYFWHSSLAGKASADTVVNTLWFAPWGVNTHIGIRLMSVEALLVYIPTTNSISLSSSTISLYLLHPITKYPIAFHEAAQARMTQK